MQTARSILPELVSGRGTSRRSRMVEGQPRGGLRRNPTQHRIRVAENIGRRNPQRLNPGRSQPPIPGRIPLRSVTPRVGLSIHFYRQPRIAAEEIQNVRPGGMLAAEL